MNLGNAIEAACGPAARGSDVARLALREALACFDAAGIDFVSREEDLARRGDLLQMHDVGGRQARRRLDVAEPRPRHGNDRDRLPQRRDRAARSAARRADAGERGRPASGARARGERRAPASMSVDELLAIVTAASDDVPG